MEIKKNVRNKLEFLLKQEFSPMGGAAKCCAIEEPPQLVKDIIERIKEEEGFTYADAYGILLLTKEYLEYEANFLSPIFSKKEIE